MRFSPIFRGAVQRAKSLRSRKAGAGGNLSRPIATVVSAFRGSPQLGDAEIFRMLLKGGMDRKIAVDLVLFLPMAYTRVLFTGLQLQLPDHFERQLSDGTRVKLHLNSVTVWEALIEYGRSEVGRGIPRQDILEVAARSAEFQVANKLLNDGGKPEDLRFTPTLVLWPEDGPRA